MRVHRTVYKNTTNHKFSFFSLFYSIWKNFEQQQLRNKKSYLYFNNFRKNDCNKYCQWLIYWEDKTFQLCAVSWEVQRNASGNVLKWIKLYHHNSWQISISISIYSNSTVRTKRCFKLNKLKKIRQSVNLFHLHSSNNRTSKLNKQDFSYSIAEFWSILTGKWLKCKSKSKDGNKID